MKLQFREKRLAKIDKRKVFILFIVFLVSLVFYNFLLNYKKSSDVTEMENPTLPIITMEALDTQVNELHGYRKEMNACYMRDAVVPLDDTRVLPMTIETYGMDIDNITYEIRSTDTTRKIAETEIKDFVQADNLISISPTIENLIDEDEEYLLVVKLTSGQEHIYYYTRILIPVSSYEKECLDFVQEFHDTALSDDYESLSTYLEPDEEAIDSLAEVSIKSSLDNVGWKGFDGELTDDPVIEIKDINSDYSVIVYYYTMKEEDGDNAKYYNVEEYFKVRYTSERMYLLDYERTMDLILDEKNIKISNNIIDLGVHSGDFTYLSNETGSIVAFVHSGSLYEYNQNTGTLTCIFSFYGDDFLDPRANYEEHDIMILNIDESGTMDFVVYGYMNAGAHEGQCGIDLYHYDSAEVVAKEQVFISSTNSYQILKARFSDLLYLATDNVFYIMVDGTLLKVDLNNLATEELVTSLSDDQYASSKSSRYFAWIDDENVSDVIHIMDLEKQSVFDIKAKDGELLRPVDFIDEDFVYGYVKESDVSTDAAGTEIYPMYKLLIQQVDDENGEVLKEYEKSGYYILSATKDSTTLILDRVTKQDDGYVSAEEDTIRNTSGEINKEVAVSYVDDSDLGRVLQITMAESDKTVSYSVTDANIALAEDMNISVSVSQSEEKYFAYVGSNVIFAGSNVQKAIIAADEQMGIVVDSNQHYIWKRGKGSTKATISGISVGSSDVGANTSAQCLSAMMVLQGENVEVNELLAQGQTPLSILSSTLKDCTVLDLTGCSLSEVLYYVYLGNPVYARIGENEAYLIVGYDALNITVFDPSSGANKKIGMEDATELFSGQGNVFISYLVNK
ncbi:MAG: hypothetical protein K5675_04460 [Lachnospiraceae bacterium]|nr:hypothetical protein [Lachnospiraceae bacterium]